MVHPHPKVVFSHPKWCLLGRGEGGVGAAGGTQWDGGTRRDGGDPKRGGGKHISHKYGLPPPTPREWHPWAQRPPMTPPPPGVGMTHCVDAFFWLQRERERENDLWGGMDGQTDTQHHPTPLQPQPPPHPDPPSPENGEFPPKMVIFVRIPPLPPHSSPLTVAPLISPLSPPHFQPHAVFQGGHYLAPFCPPPPIVPSPPHCPLTPPLW